MRCFVFGCPSDFHGYKYSNEEPPKHSCHRFPNDLERRTAWIDAISAALNRQLNVDTIHFNAVRVCSNHFPASEFYYSKGRKHLQKTAVPSLFGEDAAENGKRCASMPIESYSSSPSIPPPSKKKISAKTAQQQTTELKNDVLNCFAHDNECSPPKMRTIFRLEKFPHVCRLCLKTPKPQTEVMVPVDSPDHLLNGICIGEFIAEILPAKVGLDEENQQFLPRAVCLPCLELLKFFAKYRSKITIVHLLMNSLIDLKQRKNPKPLADLFSHQSDQLKTVIKDIGLCRREKYSVKTLLKEFSSYDLASFEGFDREEVIQKQEQCENLAEELSNLPTESGALIAEECTIEEINELTKDNPDLQVVDSSDSFPIAKEKKPPAKSKYGGQKLDKPLQCSKCRYTTYYKRNFQTHQEVHEKREARVYHCKEPGCTAEFKTRKEYKLHGPKTHKAFICDNCGLRCSSKSALRDHMARHQMRLDHKCPYCQRGHNTKADLRNHVRFAHLFNISYPCELCGMTFQRKFSLKEHLLTHSDTYNYPCTICDKKFKTNSYLKSHISVVHERVRLRCSYCPADFERNYKLHNHIENTHGIQVRFVCDVCVLTFQSQEKLDSHRARHNNPHELECGRCLSGFQSKDLLASHLCITYRQRYALKCMESGEFPQSIPPPIKIKKLGKETQRQTKALIDDVLGCFEIYDPPEASTVFRLEKFPHVCRLCLKAPKSRTEVMIPVEATNYLLGGISIAEFISEVLPNKVSSDMNCEEFLPKEVCLPCLELLKFFAKFRCRITVVHLLMSSLVKLNQYKNSAPIVDLFASQSNLVQTVIKDLGLCRKDNFSVEDLLEEFPRYDMAFSEDGVLKEEIPNQDQGESFAEELPNLPIDTGTIYAEECTIEELQELTKDNPDLLVTDSSGDYPVFKKDKPPIKSKYGGRKLDNPLQCPKCHYSTYFKRNFQTHQEVHKKRETRVYACKEPGCTEVFKTYRKYKRHGHQTFICDNCGLRCASKASLKGHLARHAMKLEHKCPYCRQGYNTNSDLRLHVRHQHLGTISYSCEICGMSFHRKNIRDGHLLTHGKSLDFPCTMCDKKFKTHKYLQKHINGVHKKLHFPCSHCSADFRTTYTRNNHIECVHGIQTRFVCDVCVQTFDSQDKLDSHRARHENPHDQECGKCLAVFKSKDLLGSHQCITYRKRCAAEKQKNKIFIECEEMPQSIPGHINTKKCAKTAQRETRNLINGALGCMRKYAAEPTSDDSTVFRLESFPHVCRLCLKAPKSPKQVMVALNATNYLSDGISIGRFIAGILPAEVTLDQSNQHFLPNSVCLECLDILKFFAKYRRKITAVHLLMNSLAAMKIHGDSGPIVDLFNNQSDLVRTVIKDLDLCRKDNYSVVDLLREFPRYDLASFEGLVIKEEELDNEPEHMAELPLESDVTFIEESTLAELTELVNNPDLLVTDSSDDYPIFKKIKAPIKSKYGGKKLDKALQCPQCRYSTFYKRNFQTHQKRHQKREDRVYACKEPGCTEVFNTNSEYRRHMPIAHKSLICDNCGLRCATQNALNTHMARHQMKLEYECPYCQRRHNTKSDLRTHIRWRHLTKKVFPCEICGMSFHRKSIRDEHLLTHSTVYAVSCTICDKKFKAEKFMRKHISVVHERVRMNCSYCPANYQSIYKLNNHIESAHGVQRRFVCDVCVQTFSSREKLDSHRARHDNPHELECATCLAVFNSKDQIGDHLCITYREDYVCCGRDLRYHYIYNKHMLTKHGVKTNVRVKPVPGLLMGQMRAKRKRIESCPKCEKIFATRTQKKQHMEICTFNEEQGAKDNAEAEGAMAAEVLMELEEVIEHEVEVQ